MKRGTLAESFVLEGVGLHRGIPARVTVGSAETGAGLTLVRSDLVGAPTWAVHVDRVRGASFATTLGPPPPSEATISTVEHLLSALSAARVDDARIEVDGPELPVLDGSAAPFVEAIAKSGVVSASTTRREIVIDRPIAMMADGDRRVEVVPAPCFGLDVSIDFDHPAIGRQSITLPEVSPESFARELAPARTFGFLKEVDWLHSQGLAAGGSLDNTVVLDDVGVMNESGLRFKDEFVRHKALDLVGDLALLGAPLRALVIARKGGHALHHRLVSAILAQPSSWHWEG